MSTGKARGPRRAKGRIDGPGSDAARHLRLELLEKRILLASDAASAYQTASPAWFGVADSLPPRAATASSELPPPAERWVVRLTPEAVGQYPNLDNAATFVQSLLPEVESVRGLGLPGQLLLTVDAAQGPGGLADHASVAYAHRDLEVAPQGSPADDELFHTQAGLANVGQDGGLVGADIDIETAWSVTTGVRDVVVGVVDTGIDFAHIDLYPNIWLNQGEIPPSLRPLLTDFDGDGQITLVDLNHPANQSHVDDSDFDGRITPDDLFADPRWNNTDGGDNPIDDDANGFANDLFGWDFRNNDNRPADDHGHGTHVAGTIGAVGNNSAGVSGVAWTTSIMPLKFLGANNRGFAADAIEAINYATMMRTRDVDPANVRVLNNSWGSNALNPALSDAIDESSAADVLFVAASGNGNIFGGVNNDDVPFFPASYTAESIVSVAASDRFDRLARFSNFGVASVDLAAPGVGINSTDLDSSYRFRNGTSMATPHVAGTAALIFSEHPDATAAEVKEALLAGVDVLPHLAGKLATEGRLDAGLAVSVDTFAPKAKLESAADVTLLGTAPQSIVVRWADDTAVDGATLDDADLLVTRLGAVNTVFSTTLSAVDTPGSGPERIVQYDLAPPGGDWDPADNGVYEISVAAGQVADSLGRLSAEQTLGVFQVSLSNPGEFFVDSSLDAVDAAPGDGNAVDASGQRTLRAAIQEANADPADNTIFLAAGLYQLTLAGIGEDAAATGDLDIVDPTGVLHLVGAGADQTTIAGGAVDRIFDVHPGAHLVLSDVTLTGGLADNGAAIRVAGGTLELRDAVARNNHATGVGGGLYVEAGDATVVASTVMANTAGGDGGGLANQGTLALRNATLSGNVAVGKGGGLYNNASGNAIIQNATLAKNAAAVGGGIFAAGGTAALQNSIVADNLPGIDPDVSGIFASLGHNLIGDVGVAAGFSTGVGDLLGIAAAPVDPLLAPLRTSVATTPTHVPLPGSPAIDAGDDAAALPFDQHGVARPADGDQSGEAQSDIGAVERYHATISGLHYHDLDGDGSQGPAEPGLEGWTVYVDLNENEQRDLNEPAAVTQADGVYQIDGVTPGSTYSVRIVLEQAWEQISPNATTSFFVVSNTADGGPGSLRQAIVDANATPGLDIIQFAIPTSGPHTITPASALPAITDPVVIDGYTQSDATPNDQPWGQATNAVLQIELDGGVAGLGVDGLTVETSGVAIRGLAINRFDRYAIRIATGTGNLVEGNFLGVDVDGVTDLADDQDGLAIESNGNLIGGESPAARNVIAGSEAAGIVLAGNFNRVQGNFIGVDAAGTTPLPNAREGVLVTGTGNVIGVDGAAVDPSQQANLISGNRESGVVIAAGSDNVVAGNWIGLDAQGIGAMGNGTAGQFSGVLVSGGFNSRIGADFDGLQDLAEANQIAHSTRHGIEINGLSTGNTLRGNSLFDNAALGIELGADGVTANDPSDADAGDNLRQNYPVLTEVRTDGANLEVTGSLHTTPGMTFTIDLYASDVADASGHGEATRYLASFDTTTDGSGDVTFSVLQPAVVAVGAWITATATDPSGNTSELSLAIETLGPREFVVDSTVDAIDANLGDGLARDASGNTTLRAAVMEANASGGHHTIVLPADLFLLARPGAEEDLAAAGDLDVATEISIVGAGADQTVLDASGLDRFFHVLPVGNASLDLSGVSIRAGNAAGPGGALLNEGDATITEVQLEANTSADAGGGVANYGTLSISRSTVAGNTAAWGGGIANDATALIADSTVSGNTASRHGGGIYNSAAAETTLTNATIVENAAATASAPGLLAPLGDEFRVNTAAADPQQLPAVAMNSSGRAVVTFNSGVSPDQDVIGQIYAADGQPVGGNFQVNSTTTDNRLNSGVAVAEDDSTVVVYQAANGDASGWGILARYYGSDGSDLGEFIVNVLENGNQTKPRATVANNQYVVAWQHSNDGDGLGVYSRRIDFLGEPLSGAFRGNAGPTGNQIPTELAAWSDGSFILGWSDAAFDQAEARVFSATSSPQTSDVVLSGPSANNAAWPAIQTTADGFIAVWQQDGAIIGRKFDRLGVPTSNEFTVASLPGSAELIPAVAALPEGGFTVAWGQGTSGLDVYYRQYDVALQPLTPAAVPVAQTTIGDQGRIQLASTPAGETLMVWQGNGPGDSDGVFARRFAVDFFRGGGIFNASGGVVALENSIVAENTAQHGDPDVAGDYSSLGHNLIGDVGDAAGLIDGVALDQVGDALAPIDPLLGPLQDNGGPTSTHLPAPNSPVVDAGNNAAASTIDQRTAPRILDGDPDGMPTVDLGAVELDIRAATFSVDVAADAPDASVGDGTPDDGAGNATLRAAIQEANVLPGFNTLQLGPGVHVLDLGGASEDGAASGDLDILDDLRIVGAGADQTIIDASALSDRVFDVFANVFLELSGVTVAGGTGLGFGTNSNGGAVRNRGALWIEKSTLDGNTSNFQGGAIDNVAGASLTILDSTLTNNVARNGAAIYNEATLQIISSTLSANATSAGSSRNGGAIHQASGNLTLEAATITQNTAHDLGGGVYLAGGNATLINTVVAGNGSTSGADPDLSGGFVSLGSNLIGDIGSASGLIDGQMNDLVGDSASTGVIDPLLGPLANYGGPTPTHSPLAGSPLIDAGDNSAVRTNDQRGVRRILDGDQNHTEIVDIGAVEFFDGFWVDSTADSVDVNPGDGQALDALGRTTLRAAVMEANALGGDRTILLEAGLYELALAGLEQGDATVGDLDITTAGSLTVVGRHSDSTTIDAAGIDRVFDVASSLRLFDVSLTGGRADAPGDRDGGGVRVDQGALTLTRVNIFDNVAEDTGGGIYQFDGTLQLFDVAVVDNRANSSATGGGGLFLDGSGLSATLDRSTISGNTALNGGGLFSYDGIVDLQTSTISSNIATSLGGGIANVAALSLAHSTVAFNQSGDPGGGVANFGNDATVEHTIIAGNTAGAGAADIDGGYVSQGYNLIGIDDAGLFAYSGDQTGTTAAPLDPLLAPLANYGGWIETHALLDGSPAIDAGDVGVSTPPLVDARGSLRLADGDGNLTPVIDIGAYERQSDETLSSSAAAHSASSSAASSSAAGSAASDPVVVAAGRQSDAPEGPTPTASAGSTSGLPGAGFWTVIVGVGDAIEAIDFGVRALPGEIRGQVFHDLDGDGQKDPFEPGLANRKVYLDDNDNGQHDEGEPSFVTAADGAYAFLDLAAEQVYVVRQVVPPEWRATFPSVGGDPWTIDLGAGQVEAGRDFGVVEVDLGGVDVGNLQGQVFVDENGNGVLDAGESGLEGEQVYLDLNDDGLHGLGEPIATTGANGDFLFESQAAGEYNVRLLPSSGFAQLQPEGVDNRPVATTLVAEAQPNSLVAGDLNRDGKTDLAVVNAGTAELSLFYNHGTGFLPAVSVDVGTAPLSIQAVQFDDDTDDGQVDENDYLDLIVGYAGTNFITILLNDGNGTFTRSDIIAPYAPWYAAPGDFNEDGHVDVATVHLNQDNVSLLQRIPGAGFVSPAPTIGTGQGPESLLAVQLTDDDGDLKADASDRIDLVWVDKLPGANTVTALLNDGELEFSPVSRSVGGRPFAVAAGDLNDDGFDDLAVTIPENNNVALLINNQSGGFALPVFVTAGLGPTAIVAADLDLDEDVDLAVTNADEEGFTLLRNDGAGNFAAEVGGAAAFPNALAVGIVAAQLDDDPAIDLAVANGLGGETVLFLANRLVERANRVIVVGNATVSNVDFALEATATGAGADFDGDGVVGGADFLAWQRGYPESAPLAVKSEGDADDDGDVDALDLAVWQSEFATGLLAATADAVAFSGRPAAEFDAATAIDLAMAAQTARARRLAGPPAENGLVEAESTNVDLLDRVYEQYRSDYRPASPSFETPPVAEARGTRHDRADRRPLRRSLLAFEFAPF